MDDDQTNLLLHHWTYSYQQKNMDELRQSVVMAMELEEARIRAKDEIKIRDEQILHLKELLCVAIKQRDEAQLNCQKLLQEKLLLQQSTQNSSIENDHRRGTIDGFSSSDCDESIVSEEEDDLPVAINRPLPEKGNLLEAVIKAGPLLQTLLLAGPLPQWRHPPPPVDAYQIPPLPVMVPPSFLHQDSLPKNVNICGRNKRGLPECSDSSINEFKYQRVLQ